MTGEEVSGPAGPKMLRLFYFIGAGGIPFSGHSLSLYISFSLLIVLSNRCFSDLHHRYQQVARLREEDDHAAAAAAKEQGSRSRS